MGFSEYPSAYDAVLWMNADFYTRILSQLGNGIIIKNGDDSVAISSTDSSKNVWHAILSSVGKGFILSFTYALYYIQVE